MMAAEEGNKAGTNMCERDRNTKRSSDWNAVPELIGSASWIWCHGSLVPHQAAGGKQEASRENTPG